MLKNLIFPVIVGLILWFAQSYIKDVPTATYSVSEAIEIVGLQGKAEFAQEIAVNNVGHSAVKSISIKVPHHISTYKLTKHSNLIKEEVVSDANGFELVYPELPTGQKFRLLVRYEGSPINKDWISVSHADGSAEAQDKRTSTINFLWIWVGYILGYITFLLFSIRDFKKKSFRKWTGGEEIFRDDKPWFASSAEWSEMQYETIQQEIEGYSYKDIEQNPAYLMLNRSKPKLLLDEHWTKLQSQAAGILKTVFSKEVNRYAKTEKLVDLFKLKKPDALSIELWSDFQASLISQLKHNFLPAHIGTEDIVKIMDPNNALLKNVPDTVANEIRDLAQKYYCEDISSRNTLGIMSDPSTILKTARFDLLTGDRAASIKKTILQFVRMNEMPASWDVNTLERFISKGRPEWMSEYEFTSMSEFVLQARNLSADRRALDSKQEKLRSSEIDVENLKKRVLTQLDFINKVLTDPTTMERVEEYENIFATGNRKNLELVASLLNQNRK